MRKKWHQQGNHFPAKSILTFAGVVFFALIHFLQKYGWSEVAHQDFTLSDMLLLYAGYLILGLLAPLLFLLQWKRPLRRPFAKGTLLLYLLLAPCFALLHNLFFSGFYYILNPAWRDYGFGLLFQDVALNYFNIALLFYLIASLLALTYEHSFQNRVEKVSPEQVLTVKDQGNTHFFKLSEIVSLTSADNYVQVQGHNKKALMRQSLNALEKQINDSRFIRVHRTAIINKDYLSHTQKTTSGEMQLVLNNGQVLPVSRRRKEAIASLLSTGQASPFSSNIPPSTT